MCKFMIVVIAAISIGIGIPNDAFALGNGDLDGALELSRGVQIRVLDAFGTQNVERVELKGDLKAFGTLSADLHPTLKLGLLSGSLATGDLTLLTSAQLSPTVIPIPPVIRIGGADIPKDVVENFRTGDLRLGGLQLLEAGVL